MYPKILLKLCVFVLSMTLLWPVGLYSQMDWTKNDGNPVISYTPWTNRASAPVVLFEDGIYKMWFAADGIAYAESPDGINWDINDQLLIPNGHGSDWDEYRFPGSVVRVGDTLKMWYSGSDDNFMYHGAIGYAWSVDNLIWHLYGDPVLEKGLPGSWEEILVITPSVLYDGNQYQMWYSGGEGDFMSEPMQIGYATSPDGIHWRKDILLNPVLRLGPEGSFYDRWAFGPTVIKIVNEYQMWFAGWDGTSSVSWRYIRIGYATSENGYDWNVRNNDIAAIDVGGPGQWDYRWARYSSVLHHGGKYQVWFDGRGSKTAIGYAEEDKTVIRVPDDFPTIQAAIDYAEDGYTVLVDTGIYYENIDFKGKAITVTSFYHLSGDKKFITHTIIDGGRRSVPYNASVVSFISGEDTNSVLKGFTIRGGTGNRVISSTVDILGGGICCLQSGATIEHNHIVNNHCSGVADFIMGGGIGSDYCPDRTVIIRDNLISGNSCKSNDEASVGGGGIAVFSNATITGNIITNNSIYQGYNKQACGGGILGLNGTIIITENTIARNSAENSTYSYNPSGGGIFLQEISGGSQICYNTIANNNIEAYNSTGCGIGVYENLDKFLIDGNIIRDNSGASRGGGITMFMGNSFEITNNVIHSNTALLRGGGIYLHEIGDDDGVRSAFPAGSGVQQHSGEAINPSYIIANNTIVGNLAENHGGGIATLLPSKEPVIFNNIIYDNIAGLQANGGDAIALFLNTHAYLFNNDIDVEEIVGSGYWEGSGNFLDEPCFCDKCYHLDCSSTCIDAGLRRLVIQNVTYECPEFDMEGDPRTNPENPVDLGADETPFIVRIDESDVAADLIPECKIYPNPASGTVHVSYQLPFRTEVAIGLYSASGERVKQLLQEEKTEGEHQVKFSVEDVAPGVYLIRIQTGNQSILKKLVIM